MHYVHGSDIAEQLVNEVMRLAAAEGWKLWNEENGIKSYQLPSDNNIMITMIETILPAPAEYVHNVTNLTSPVAWTSTCTKSETIERYDHLNTIVHLRTVSMFFGGQALETLFFRTIHMELNKKLFVQGYRSIENDQFKFEEGSIVLTFLPSAWIVDVPPDIDQQHCRLRLITQTDPNNNVLAVGGTVPGMKNYASLLRNPGAGFGDAFMYLRNYIIEHYSQKHPDPLLKIGISTETEWADTYCSMNEACGWTAHVKKYGLGVYSKLDLHGRNIIAIKGSYHCPQPLNEVFQSFEIPYCSQWEPFVESGNLIQKVDDYLSLIRLRVKSPVTQVVKDHALLTIYKKVIGNLGVILFRSASHESVPVTDDYFLLPSGLSFQPYESGGCLVSFMMQGHFTDIDPSWYAPVVGARIAMSIASNLKFLASNFGSTNRHYKSVPLWIAEKITVPRKGEEMVAVCKRITPLAKLVLDELDANHRLNFPHTAIELGVKRKRVAKPAQSITTINTEHIAEKRKGQFVRPFIFLVSNKDARSKYLKRVSMACSHSYFDFLGPDILTDIVLCLGIVDVLAFSQVCKCFHFFTTGNRAIWKSLFWRRYGDVYTFSDSKHWILHHGGGGSHHELGNTLTNNTLSNNTLTNVDSFDDWREHLVGKMSEERGWRLGRMECKEMQGHVGNVKFICAYEAKHSSEVFLCSASDEGVIKVWGLERSDCISTIITPAHIIGIQNIPNTAAPNFVVGCKNGGILFYDWSDLECTQDITFQDTTLDGFLCLEQNTVIWAGQQLQIFDNNTGQRARTYLDHPNDIRSIMSSKNERLLYSGYKDGKVIMRDLLTDPALPPSLSFVAHEGAPVNCVKWVKMDASFVTTSKDGSVKLWDSRNTSRPIVSLSGHNGPVTCVDTFDRYKVVTGGKDKTVRIWSVLGGEGEELREFDGVPGKISCVAVFHNEIFTGSLNGDLRRWTFEL